jgi:hypothetical protein
LRYCLGTCFEGLKKTTKTLGLKVSGARFESRTFRLRNRSVFLNWYSGGWNPRSTRHCGHQWPIVPPPGDYDNGEIGGMMIGRGNRRTRRRPAPVPLYPSQTPHAVRKGTRAAAVGSQRLTA